MPTSHVNPVASTIPPWAVQQRIGTAAGRYALNSMLMPRTDSGLTYTDYRSGVMASGDGDTTHLAMQVTAGTGMSVDVAQGNAVINTPNQGAYMACLDSTKTVTVPASSAQTSRYDLVVASVRDDNNSALAGTPGERAFVVEIIQGDPTTGMPVIPEAPVGSIPLASLYIARNAADLVNGTDPNHPSGAGALIQDLRGPGIVARGGMRALYGADSLKDSEEYAAPGAYPGDQRWAHQAGFQHQVYYGESQGWRGVMNAQVFNKSPTNETGTWLWTPLRAGARREWARVVIPYPGTPFMIYPSARVYGKLSTFTAGEVMLTLDSPTGTVLTWAGIDIGDAPDDTTQTMNVAPIMWGPFYEGIEVVLHGHVAKTIRSGGGGIASHNSARTVLSVVVFPSTVAPPGADPTGGQPQYPNVPPE